MQKDIVLINPISDPVICKISDFRNEVVTRFYSEIVEKRNEERTL